MGGTRRHAHTAIFLRVLEAKDKAATLRQAIADPESPLRFEVDPESFRAVPRAPFAYWASERLRAVFRELPRFEGEGRTAKQGLATADDFRFVRLWTEVPEAALRTTWFPFAKGGKFSPFYADVYLVVNWAGDGAEVKNNLNANGAVRSNVWMLRDTADKFFFRSGLTWPLRAARFGPSVLPSGSIPSVRGYAAYTPDDERFAVLAVFNSAAFDGLFKLCLGRAGFPEFIVGVLNTLPWAMPDSHTGNRLATLARGAWSLKRALDTANETSHAFLLPPGLNEKVTGLDPVRIERELAEIQRQIDDEVYRLYGIGPEDRVAMEAGAGSDPSAAAGEDDEDETHDDEAPATAATDALLSWLLGVAFGRFDPRLATGERALPPEPEPFDPLPSRSPGMYPPGEDPADAPDILVDDEGHTNDLAARVTSLAERVNVTLPENLRAWLAKEFFPLHIKMYSKSYRKAPIYWQLATPSASYSVWLYIHAFSKDTLFRVQNDYVAPKLAHEERRLEALTRELREGATASQRKQLAAQEARVEELRAFLDEVKRVAPLWNPTLDDGITIHFAPLWRLVPQHKAWQKELKSTWDALCEGKYDWAHLAMHLWPERVVPKCAKDRSIAIAHGLEDVFWVEGTDGKWTARKTPTKSVDELVKERTSPAVKSALKSLLEAPVASGKSTGRKGGGRRKSAAAAEGGDA